MSHSPGPWKIGYGGREGDGYFTITSSHRKHSIADGAEDKDLPDAEIRANALLIASAPDLLDELWKSANTFADTARAFRLLNHDVAAEAMDVAAASNRAVIAKAEGKEK